MYEIILSAENLRKVFKVLEKENVILDHINVELHKNDFTVIMGSSGAGKSTLLYTLSGMDTISGGSIKVLGKTKELHRMSEKEMAEIRSDRFGFVFQQMNLVSNLTIEENILVAGYNKKLKFVRYRIQFVEQIKPNPKTGKKPLVLAGGLPDALSA